MEYPETVIARTPKGPEVRAFVSRGEYVLCEYLDPQTSKPASGKKKLVLKDEQGEREYFIIPLKQPRKFLLIQPSEKEGEQGLIWNRKTNKAETLWQ